MHIQTIMGYCGRSLNLRKPSKMPILTMLRDHKNPESELDPRLK